MSETADAQRANESILLSQNGSTMPWDRAQFNRALMFIQPAAERSHAMASHRTLLVRTQDSLIIRRGFLLLCLMLLLAPFCWAQQDPRGYPQQFEGDFNAPDFTFQSGEKLPQLRLHYITL